MAGKKGAKSANTFAHPNRPKPSEPFTPLRPTYFECEPPAVDVPANWSEWRQRLRAELWEAVALSINVEPITLKGRDSKPVAGSPFKDCSPTFQTRLRVAIDHLEARELPCAEWWAMTYRSKVSLAQFATWALARWPDGVADELAHMAQSDIDPSSAVRAAIAADHNEYSEAQREREEEWNGTAIEWEYWVRKMRRLTVVQAVRLMAGLDPETFSSLALSKNDKAGSAKLQARRLEQLAKSHEKSEDTPAGWCAWTLSLSEPVHGPFREAVEQSTKSACADNVKSERPAASDQDWKSKVKAIADEFDANDAKVGAWSSIDDMAHRVAREAGERGIVGAHGQLTAANIRREALQGGRWQRKRQRNDGGKSGKSGKSMN